MWHIFFTTIKKTSAIQSGRRSDEKMNALNVANEEIDVRAGDTNANRRPRVTHLPKKTKTHSDGQAKPMDAMRKCCMKSYDSVGFLNAKQKWKDIKK